jgi:signal transduction histidine kinase
LLAASIAHEVNQPLSGIITNASTCLRMLALNPPNIQGALETARRTIRDGNRAAEVVTHLRALFANNSVPAEPVNLNDTARDVIALTWDELKRNNVVLQLELTDDLPPVAGLRVQLQQVILNLLRNGSEAMKNIEDRPRLLLIKTEREAHSYVRLTIVDSGIGFNPQATEMLFEAFYTTKSNGMGIGLSVCRSIVERSRGRLWAMPNDGPGATFSFSIPCFSEDVETGVASCDAI